MEQNQLKRYGIIGVIAAAVCLFVMYFETVIAAVKTVIAAAAPLLLGMVIAYVLNLLLRLFERFYFPKSRQEKVMKSRRPMCILLSFLALFVILILLANLVVPELISAIRLVMDEIPSAAESARQWLIAHSDMMPSIRDSLEQADINWQEMVKKTLDVLVTGAGGIFGSVLSFLTGFFGTVAKVLIGTIFAIYLLSAKETLAAQADSMMKAYVKPQMRIRILYVADTMHKTFTSFIAGQCAEAVIIGTLCALGMFLLRMPYAVMTGTVVGVTALIPVVGAYIGAAVGAFMVFTVNPIQALGFVIYLVLLQQLEGNLIYPKVVGSSIGLPGLWVLAAVTIGGGIFGIGGMLLGVPLTAAVYRLVEADVEKRLSSSVSESDETVEKDENDITMTAGQLYDDIEGEA